MNIIAKTPLHLTEDRMKVEECFKNILENPQIEEEINQEVVFLVIKSTERKNLSIIRDKLRHQRILDSVRKLLLHNMTENSVKFFLNKQAAYSGRIHFVKDPKNEDFLGPIEFTIIDDNIKDIIDWLTSSEFQR